jgi:integrase
MNFAQLQIGTENASPLPVLAGCDAKESIPVRTTGDLLAILQKNPTRSLKMLRTVCGHLGKYLDLPGDQIPFDLIEIRKRGFRPFLESRRYTENSIRSYVYQQRKLLKAVMRHGWNPDGNPAEAWKPLLELAGEEKLTDILRYFARTTKSPAEVTKEAVDRWGEDRFRDGLMFTTVSHKKNDFWRLLQKTDWVTGTPAHMLKFEKYGIPLKDLPPRLRADAEALLKWKQAPFAPNRPKKGKIRATTATGLRLTISQLAGYVINVCGGAPESLKDLVQKHNVEGYIEWAFNERHIKGRSIQLAIARLAACVKYHPAYADSDWTWLKSLIDSIPIEDESEIKKRKASKYIDYDEFEAIPTQIRAFREAYEKKKRKSEIRVAQLAMEELLVRWFLSFPWRQRNLRELRIGGAKPNLFKGKIPSLSDIDKPAWTIEEEARNPEAEFWMITFAPDETKTHITVDLLLPRTLVEPLEEYLAVWRPLLLNGKNPDTLFVTPRGKPMRSDQVGKVIGHWSKTFASKRTTPHLIRDSVAYKWLKEHHKDYLTLSKILWHKNVQTTICIYGARFNESSGMCAIEQWLDQRAAGQN